MAKIELTNFQKDMIIDALSKFSEHFEKIGETDPEIEAAKSLLENLGNSSYVELDIYGKTIANAIISTVYQNGVEVAKNESNKEFEKEQFEKQERYKRCFNEIFGYSDDSVFDSALSVYPTRSE